MKKRTDKLKGLQIDITLSEQDRLMLSTYVRTQAFDIMQTIMEDQVNKFNMRLINTAVNKPSDVIANHSLAKGVAQFYQGLMDRIEEECQIQNFNNSTYGTKGDPENQMQLDELR